MPNDVRYGVKKWRIMGNDNKGILIVLQVARKPLNMFRIQIIGRFVKKQDVRMLKEELCKKHLRALTARKLIDLMIKANIAQSKARRDFLDFCIKVVVISRLQPFLDFGRIRHEALQLVR